MNSTDIHAPLRHDIRLMGKLLGDTLRQQVGQALYDKVEAIRSLAKQARDGDIQATQTLNTVLASLNDEELLPVARAFTHFLNLANIAEQYHSVRLARTGQDLAETTLGSLNELFPRLKQQQISPEQLWHAIQSLDIELVLTAHPTEVSRRTLIQKYDHISACLEQLDSVHLTTYERERILDRLKNHIVGAWRTDEIRQQRPTPIDEAKWGFTAIEQTLWHAIPQFLRQLDKSVFQYTGRHIPLTHAPIRFASWMGGDRDGNPNVTHSVTEEVLLLARWQAADLYWQDLDNLRADLSMADCDEVLRQSVGPDCREPYREVLRHVRDRVAQTREAISARLRGERIDDADCYLTSETLLTPLQDCHRSLVACNMANIANAELSDIIRRIACFGTALVKLDIRQESGRHTAVLEAITQYLQLGHYQTWTENEKQAFLLKELTNPRPLLAKQIALNDYPALAAEDVQEVLNTFNMLARQPADALGAYIISMAKQPSDILAVMLLQKEAGICHPLRVVPLFETLADLDNAAPCLEQLLNIEWYKTHIAGQQEIMIGYSDSAKDAGFLSASWAQYRAQEQLTAVAQRHGIQLTLFHGRGGSISRGGAPTHQALLSQPPQSIQGKIRVTEQGEMIRFKFGMLGIALRHLELYTAATLEATLLPPPAAKPEWRQLMDNMTQISFAVYKETVRDTPDFIRYLRTVTPELELQMLPLGSRPARRHSAGGIESLRAIPWVFAWTQVRLMLPAWLGTGRALASVMQTGNTQTLQEMRQDWPYFQTVLAMLEMVLAKADAAITQHYEQQLTHDPTLHQLGGLLRARLAKTVHILLTLTTETELLSQSPLLKRSLTVRTPYILPLHMLQAELMRRRRSTGQAITPYDHALMISIAGIAAGLRNTG
ncbi:phosphoenolpyruvate carboxylase [Agitococcus lubricus]|uniref:Phosphoenolpyruvate carboxylase n=1 Tax=Agitococcus lubricus TaxID=1077255 RepID=A0A2T5IY47_9GAMM|nr:phosphoenolpyruvate carboxylase [Agitococcus lubricus]PTQ88911.1 phosphoenolpyruvate carboxylase type 1 [Agitococcus lubricus]